ncbi:MAG: YggT family protein [Gammaproteobacteria bacterium]|nr:YggT family protein [Gammaproteobacteria bacterium]MCY4210351.1 YggT family protein [Gammaproteobacteria bacterium]MCY4282724.1 YggT family protein [Gammaproteobacteria bacterium]MCY4339237.1 YggT family protein [Gammaproteobacteria bacterium]
MANSYLSDALLYLVNTVFALYILLVTLRFLLQTVRADARNPLSQFLLRATDPPLRLLRRVAPGFGGVDWSCIILMVALQSIKLFLAGVLAYGTFLAPSGLLLLSVAELMRLIIYIFMFVIFLQIILSWVNPGAYNPMTVLLHQLSEPLLGPARRLLPAVQGIDLSPILVFVFLQLSLILLVRPLADLGRALAL